MRQSGTSTFLLQNVEQDATTLSLTTSTNPSAYGKSVTFTAAVKAASPGSGTPTGSVTFHDGSQAIQTVTLATGTPDIAKFAYSRLSVYAHSITAIYGGVSNFTSSTSKTVIQQVNQGGGAFP
jgi:hypothetical protein